MSATDIKSMRLYAHLERINNELAGAGIDPDGPLTVDQLSPFDNLHYHGTDALDLAIAELGIDGNRRIAEIGSGLGGPARYIAERTGCRVTALELQSDLNALAKDLTRRCGLSERVTHVCGDVLDGLLDEGGYDAAVSWLALYHIADHDAVFAHLASALKPGGLVFIEDLTTSGTYTSEELELFRVKIYGRAMPNLETYVEDLARAGFRDIRAEDLSADWRDFTHDRHVAYRANLERHLRIHGPDIVAEMLDFYDIVDRLFGSGKLGGLRVVARLP